MSTPPVFVDTDEATLLGKALLRINDADAILEDREDDIAGHERAALALAILKRGQI